MNLILPVGIPSPPRTPWLLRRAGPLRGLRLYCFAYAGGDAGMYLSWQTRLGPDIEICGVQLPGRGARLHEPVPESLPTLVEQIATVIADQAPQPFALFGHSLGALLAFEVARHLDRIGVSPRHLFVSGCQAPTHRGGIRPLHLLSDEGLLEVLRDFNGTPPEVLRDREFMSLVLPTLRADFALACEYAYRPGPQLSVPMTVLAGTGESGGRWGEVGRWADQTVAPCRLHWFDGDHFFIHSHKHAVIDRVRGQLLEASPPLPAAMDTARSAWIES